MKKLTFVLIALMIIPLLSGCADVSNIQECVAEADAYGFWSGLWHGLITPFSFIGSLFSDNIAVYAVNNIGGWYDFGFLLGVGGLGFGSSKANN